MGQEPCQEELKVMEFLLKNEPCGPYRHKLLHTKHGREREKCEKDAGHADYTEHQYPLHKEDELESTAQGPVSTARRVPHPGEAFLYCFFAGWPADTGGPCCR
jgi:hypothetical protein